uniref:Metallophosphoesterase n=1 Tax=uncultured organism TaxID=155900 RepID=M1PQB9_9ZZZZ|nr:metallophosphoesterase [uncultured organism]
MPKEVHPEPLWNQKALKIEKTLIIADLHIGYERELEKKGVHLPSQTEKMVDNVIRKLEENEFNKLIIVGDLKHNIPQATWQEYKEIPKAMEQWLRIVDEIHILKGNHDGNISKYVPSEVHIHDSSGSVIDGIGYFHGHANPSKEVVESGMVIIAHNHPTVTLVDSLDNKQKEQCWVRFNYRKDDLEGRGIIIPHYNPLLGGVSINENEYLGPFLRNEDIFGEEIYLLDGTYIGKKENLELNMFQNHSSK